MHSVCCMKFHRLHLLGLWILTAAFAGYGCQSGPKIVPRSLLNEQSQAAFQQMQQQLPVSRDATAVARVNTVGERVADVVRPERPDIQWQFVLFEDPAVNAFALPGGQVGVYRGLLDLVDSDDELAIVIGHEIAHIMLEHGNQRMSAELLRAGAAVALAYTVRNREQQEQMLWMAAFGLGSQVGILLPYSRRHEYEADQFGLFYAARAGYDPRAAISFWEKMTALAAGGSVPEFLSTHPNHGNRIQRLQNDMPVALQYFHAAGGQ